MRRFAGLSSQPGADSKSGRGAWVGHQRSVGESLCATQPEMSRVARSLLYQLPPSLIPSTLPQSQRGNEGLEASHLHISAHPAGRAGRFWVAGLGISITRTAEGRWEVILEGEENVKYN